MGYSRSEVRERVTEAAESASTAKKMIYGGESGVAASEAKKIVNEIYAEGGKQFKKETGFGLLSGAGYAQEYEPKRKELIKQINSISKNGDHPMNQINDMNDKIQDFKDQVNKPLSTEISKKQQNKQPLA